MPAISAPVLNSSLKKVEEYYDTCWLDRFENGHNPKSLAMHLGFYEHGGEDSETAKINLNKALVGRLGIAALVSPVLVDAGCGVGGTSIYLARQFADVRISCLNASARQIRLAERFASQAGVLDALEFIHCDFSTTGLPPESADAVFAIESLCHAPDKKAFFAEAYRILKPGGKFAAFDYTETELSYSDENRKDYRAFCDGWAVGRYLENPRSELEAAGFRDVFVEDLTQNVYPGILRSDANARAMLRGPGNFPARALIMHYEACIALKSLADRQAIAYSYLAAAKPTA